MSKFRTYSWRKIAKDAKPHFYKQKALIHKINYLYPDGKYSLEIKPCVWNKGSIDEYEGYPSCSGQLVCPYVGNWRYKSDGTKIIDALGRCGHECTDPMIREAIEAWISLHPNIY
jgi:hypothetical protein